jgi:hypothetical protein
MTAKMAVIVHRVFSIARGTFLENLVTYQAFFLEKKS